MRPGDDYLFYAVESTVLVSIATGWGLVLLLRRLRHSRPNLRIGRPLAVGVLLRALVVGILSATPSLAALRGPDEVTFTTAAMSLDAAPALGNQWVSAAIGDFHTVYFAALFRVLQGQDPSTLRVVQIALAATAVCLVAAAVHDLAGARAAQVFAWVAALEPAGIFFSGIIHKEAPMMLAEALVVFGGVRFWLRRDLPAVAIMVGGCVFALATRPYAGAVLGVAAALVVFHGTMRHTKRRRLRVTVVALALVGIVAAGATVSTAPGEGPFASLQRSQDANASDDSNLRLEPIDLSSPAKLALNGPRRMADLLSRPYPWQLGNRSQQLAAVGTLIAWALLLLAATGIVLDWRLAWRRIPPLLYAVVMVTVGYSLSVGNAGTGFRYRTHVVLLLAAVVAVLLGPRWAQRSAEKPSKPLGDHEPVPAIGQ